MNIVRLIRDDIKISRLINTLEQLNVSAYQYTLGNSKVIFSLMGIPDEEQNFEIYYKMIEQGEDLTKYDSNEKIEELAEDVFKQLMIF
ncbi:hypothetical protein D3C87_308440 [compost metagenome]